MKRQSLAVILVGTVVLLAGCTGGISGSPGASGTETDRSDGSPTPSADGGTIAFYISDEANAIGDFEHLNVTVTSVGFERASEDNGGWIERSVDNVTVDLTEFQGANATLVDEYDVPNGTYEKVFVHVDDVNATLQNGEHVRVKLPSEKLQLETPFVVENGKQVDFVFDITVHRAGKSGKYVLQPVVSESGTDVPIEATEEEDPIEVTEEEDPIEVTEEEDPIKATEEEDPIEVTEEENRPNASIQFVGNVSQGENATVRVLYNGSAVENATIEVDGETVGTTDADGELTFEVPTEESMTVTAHVGNEEVEIEREFEFDGSV